ncbi:hypothetical protein [Oscillatoria sp. HE19RPO]|nr:hypothetical protein [Oscillatoria sp. HE19RPO]
MDWGELFPVRGKAIAPWQFGEVLGVLGVLGVSLLMDWRNLGRLGSGDL